MPKHLVIGAIGFLLSSSGLVALGDEAPRPLVSITNPSAVWSTELSPAADILAVGCLDGTVSLWKIPSGVQVKVWQAHRKCVSAVRFAPDNKTLVSASHDRCIIIWDAASAQEKQRFKHDGAVSEAMFSRDGKRIVSGSFDGTVRVWDASTGQVTRLCRSNDMFFRAAIHPNSETVVGGGDDHIIHIWENDKQVKPRDLKREKGSISGFAFSSDGKRMFTASYYGDVCIWDTSTWECDKRTLACERGVTSLVLSPDGKLLAIGGGDGSVRLLDSVSGKQHRIIAAHEDNVWTVSFSSDGSLLSSGSIDKTAKVWRVRDLLANPDARK